MFDGFECCSRLGNHFFGVGEWDGEFIGIELLSCMVGSQTWDCPSLLSTWSGPSKQDDL